MNRKKFLAITGGSMVMAGVTYYTMSDKSNLVRTDIEKDNHNKIKLLPHEQEILFLASLAPSGHNTQPWFIKYIDPYHWIICNDKTRWLTAVDPTQRETILSIGAFLQNLEYAAASLGYNCQCNILAVTNQDENIMEIQLIKKSITPGDGIRKIMERRTVRSNYLNDGLKKEDLDYLINAELDYCHFMPNTSKEYHLLNEQTIEANQIQSYRDAAENELADWIRFSSKEAEKYRDGLTTAGMELNGIPGWVVRNFYGKHKVMEKGFRDQNIASVVKQVSQSAGWLLITSKDNSVTTLIETGKRMQRLFLKVKDKGIALHPMTQILEESSTNAKLNKLTGISDTVQFILRTGYLKTYPEPVSLRRPVDWFVRKV